MRYYLRMDGLGKISPRKGSKPIDNWSWKIRFSQIEWQMQVRKSNQVGQGYTFQDPRKDS